MRKPCNLSVTGTRTSGKLQHASKSARALTPETSGNSHRQGSETLQGPIKRLIPFQTLHFATPSKMKMATDANIKQDNSRSSSTVFLRVQKIMGNCPCRGFTLMQASARTMYHSSISANYKTKWGKSDQFAVSSIVFLINLHCPGKRGRRELVHALWSSGGGWQDLSRNPE